MALRPSEWSVVASGTNAIANAAKAGEAGRRHYVTGFTVSARGGAVAAAVTLQVRDSAGANVRDQVEVAAAALAPLSVNYDAPIEGPVGANVDINLPALGVGITGTVVLRGYSL